MGQGAPPSPEQWPQLLRSHPPALQRPSQGCRSAPQPACRYEPLHLDYGQPHPDAVVETTSLSFAELPRITMHSHLPQGMQKPKSDANPYALAG